MRNTFLSLFLLVLVLSLPTWAKKYRFQAQPSYEVEQIRVDKDGLKFVKAWGIGKNADKAIVQAKQNAVAACVFTGVAATDIAGRIPPLCLEGVKAAETHQDYFEQFFVSGEFLQYVSSVNSRYPTGENNVKTDGGRKVGVYLEVKYDALRQKLEQDGIVRGLNDYF